MPKPVKIVFVGAGSAIFTRDDAQHQDATQSHADAQQTLGQDQTITTPVTTTTGKKLAKPRPVVVPILRAGLGMLEGMTQLLPRVWKA